MVQFQPGIPVGCSWSGGKDSCYALMQAIQQGAVPKVLVNMMNENGRISRSHGLPLYLLQQQAAAMETALIATPTTWKDYEHHFVTVLQQIKATYQVEAMVFGDIDLQPHRDWEEAVCAKAALTPLLPIWQRNRKELVLEMLAAGMETMIVSCNLAMGESYLGRILSPEVVEELEAKGIDACGENGEFHTLVLNCTLFRQRIVVPPHTTTRHEDYYFITWEE